jgi:hypothetical protein
MSYLHVPVSIYTSSADPKPARILSKHTVDNFQNDARRLEIAETVICGPQDVLKIGVISPTENTLTLLGIMFLAMRRGQDLPGS